MATGDSGAIRELYGLYWKTMYAAAFKGIPDHEVVKDILQDVFLQLWPRKNTLDIDHLPAYLYNAIRNQVFKRFEKEVAIHPLKRCSWNWVHLPPPRMNGYCAST